MRVWNVSYTDKIGNPHELEVSWHHKPSREIVAQEILVALYNSRRGQNPLRAIDVLKTDQTPRLTKLGALGYTIVRIKEVDPNAQA